MTTQPQSVTAAIDAQRNDLLAMLAALHRVSAPLSQLVRELTHRDGGDAGSGDEMDDDGDDDDAPVVPAPGRASGTGAAAKPASSSASASSSAPARGRGRSKANKDSRVARMRGSHMTRQMSVWRNQHRMLSEGDDAGLVPSRFLKTTLPLPIEIGADGDGEPAPARAPRAVVHVHCDSLATALHRHTHQQQQTVMVATAASKVLAYTALIEAYLEDMEGTMAKLEEAIKVLGRNQQLIALDEIVHRHQNPR